MPLPARGCQFFEWELVLTFLVWGVGPSFSGWGWPVLLQVELVLFFGVGVGPSFLEVVFGPSFLWLGLAFPSPGGDWPSLLASGGEVRHFFLSEGLALRGVGHRNEGCSCLLGMGWPSPLEGWCLALPSRDGELAFLSRAWFFSSVVVGPSFLPFLLAVSGPHFFLDWGLALRDESWPCRLGVEIGFLLSLTGFRPSFSGEKKAMESSEKASKQRHGRYLFGPSSFFCFLFLLVLMMFFLFF